MSISRIDFDKHTDLILKANQFIHDEDKKIQILDVREDTERDHAFIKGTIRLAVDLFIALKPHCASLKLTANTNCMILLYARDVNSLVLDLPSTTDPLINLEPIASS